MVDCVSETIRDSWLKVFELDIREFFGYVMYATYKAKEREKLLSKYK